MLRNISLILRLPPMFRENGVLRDHVAKLLPGEEKKILFRSGPESADPLLSRGTMRAYFQADFRTGGKNKRVHSVFISPRKMLPTDCPRDNVRIIGPLPAETELPPGFAKDVSTMGHPLKNYDDSPAGKWHPMTDPGHGILGVHPSVKGADACQTAKEIISLYLLDFEAPSAGKMNLFRWRTTGQIFLNGKEIPADPETNLIPAEAKKGWNRVLFIIRGPQWNMDAAVSVSVGDEPLNHLPCRMPR